ncbi:MAG: PolC-type DNA polymerase III [Firmicutes bacterium HGW-Firmicutes-7]|nr:MAG: PolC-type DNA polymerase III [Firmicutes bacterium HGW-Firmicutes-7]
MKLTKVFKDVFPKIKLGEPLNNYFNECCVENVFLNKNTNQLIINITLTQIITPQFVEKLAEVIKIHLNVCDSFQVIVNEKFIQDVTLSFKEIYELYKGAIYSQIMSINPVCGVKLANSDYIIKDNIVTYEFSEQLYEYFKRYDVAARVRSIFSEKFGLDMQIELNKKEGLELVEKFIERHDIEQKMLLQELHIDSMNSAAKALPKKTIKKTDKENLDAEKILIGKKGISGELTYIKSFSEETNEVILEGFVINYEERDIKGDKKLIIFDLTDYTASVTCKSFLKLEQYMEQTVGKINKGLFVRISGRLQYDEFQKENIVMVNGLELIDDFRKQRKDTAEVKRVELHLHTQMSDMDAVVSAKDVVKQAIKWGHKAVAITDHGVVQAFPDAFHAAEKSDIKIIYGVEAYIVDDEKPTIKNPKGQNFDDVYVVFDLETTGFYPGADKITEIGAVKIKNRTVIDRYSTFVNPERGIPAKVQKLTGITPEMVQDAPIIEDVLKEFLEFVGDDILVAHNADFDLSFIKYFAQEQNVEIFNTSVDTLELSRTLFPDLKNHKLNTLASEFNVTLTGHHRAVNDAEATAGIFVYLSNHLDNINIHNLEQFINYESTHFKNNKKLRSNHAIMLAQNLVGLRNLYELISKSHINYYFKQPRIPKSVFRKYREGILLGSACEAGEIYKAIRDHKDHEEVDRLARFYDYFEIQPLANNEFLIRDNIVAGKHQLIDINKKIVELSKQYGKLTVATCDVHFLNPEDEVYRRILMAGKGFSDADQQAPLYYRTTDEMLAEFYYLGDQVAYEVVVENTNKIAELIEKINPVPPEKFPPKIDGSEDELRRICYEKAKDMYGEKLPEIVSERLDRELNSIITNGFAVMYIIAQKLVWKSNEDGYLVGSRGSVGSSFAATMSGITEVNPLSAHYLCPKCKYVDFDSEVVKAHSGNSGCDLADMRCPVCGENLHKEGHDIPFETFLGFEGDKEPDIDLNFSGEYQSKAHEFTEELFGTGHVFRAGTIGSLAEKTAFGFVKKYFDERNTEVNKAEINRLVSGCTGVRRTTGQHPGGIIVVPKEQEIYKFTPIQRPANDMTSSIITTHFDYHSIDHNLLKLDILGHDDPTIIKMLEDITGVDARTIPLDEPKVMSLFSSTKALGITPDKIGGCTLGCLGVPEFGTDFVMQMLMDTKPKSFSDLARISGLSHGTDVWLNNAQEIIKEGKANISEVISTRDDIMTYLIHQGVDKGLSFTIMESVRKGKGLKDEWIDAMKENGVPDWYIWSCKQIKYMFPKAHAVAYVMMAYRIAYFKVYYPIAYYTAFYSIRASNFDYEMMCKGKEQLEEHLKVLKERDNLPDQALNKLTKKEKDMIKDMRIVQEMYARGIDFMPIDLYKVDATRFQIFENKIMPSLSAIEGLGGKAAINIIEARKDGAFVSIEDLRERTRLTKTVIEVMKQNGILQGLSDTNQMSLF